MASVKLALRDFGVTDVIVTLKNVAPGDSVALTASHAAVSDVVKHFRSSMESHRGAVAMSLGRRRRPQRPYRVYPNLGVVLGTVDERGYKALLKHPDVKAVNGTPQISLIKPNKVAAAKATKDVSWGIKRLRANELWAKDITGKGVLVGHLDTGVDARHPALKGAVASFVEIDLDGNRKPGAKPHDSDEHGTHTAGTIVGREVKGSEFGIAPGARLASTMVIEGGDVVARILEGLDWVIGQKVKVLSMSLGLRGYHEDFVALMQAVRNRGVLPVIAVGNEGPGTSRSPGNYEIVLSVGACDNNDEVAGFSSSQSLLRPVKRRVPDFVAPGVGILSSIPNGGFAKMDGSSMATPHIAGLAALLWEAKPSATVDEIENAILKSCTLPKTMTVARANRGVPDAVKALAILQGKSATAGKTTAPAVKKQAVRKNSTARKRSTKTKRMSS
ncbi:MAG: S8 family serine peptidase [Planctomycetia bacterium]|nr:S8 family serine peptidase [Planctomycetia bacterium]